MKTSRRKFIKNSSLFLLGSSSSFLFPTELLASIRKRVGANDQINMGLIGCNGMGFSNLLSLLKISEVSVIALCDVDDRKVAETLEKTKEEEGKEGQEKGRRRGRGQWEGQGVEGRVARLRDQPRPRGIAAEGGGGPRRGRLRDRPDGS